MEDTGVRIYTRWVLNRVHAVIKVRIQELWKKGERKQNHAGLTGLTQLLVLIFVPKKYTKCRLNRIFRTFFIHFMGKRRVLLVLFIRPQQNKYNQKYRAKQTARNTQDKWHEMRKYTKQ